MTHTQQSDWITRIALLVLTLSALAVPTLCLIGALMLMGGEK